MLTKSLCLVKHVKHSVVNNIRKVPLISTPYRQGEISANQGVDNYTTGTQMKHRGNRLPVKTEPEKFPFALASANYSKAGLSHSTQRRFCKNLSVGAKYVP
jgi:hypothetical protein